MSEGYRLQNFLRSRTPLGTLTDPEAVDYTFLQKITVGQQFRALATDTVREVRDLPAVAGIFERVFSGGFGTGKTHMALWLYYNMAKVTPDENELIITLDFSRLSNNADHVDYLIFSGMHVAGGYGYRQACTEIFSRLKRHLEIESSDQLKNVLKQFFNSAYRAALDIEQPAVKLIAGVFERNLGDEARNLLRDREIKTLIRDLQSQTTPEFTVFLEELSDLVANPDSAGESFDSLLHDLSEKHVLLDILFKLLRVAGYTRVVIMADELESLNPKGNLFLQQVLNRNRDIRDTTAQKAGSAYPAVAMMYFATPPFLDENVQAGEPALWTRWHGAIFPMPEASIDETIEQILPIVRQNGLITGSLEEDTLVENIIAEESPEDVVTFRWLLEKLYDNLRATG